MTRPAAPQRIAGAVLAAGAGSRMGGPKAELRLDGVRLVDRAVATLVDGGCDPVVAVVRPGTPVSGATAVVNPDPARGQRSSLDLAVRAVPDADAIAVVLVDTPGVGAEAVRRVIAAWRPGRVAVARYADRRGHPIVMEPRWWSDAIDMAGPDEGARRYLAARARLVDEIDVEGDQADLDLPADLDRWRSLH